MGGGIVWGGLLAFGFWFCGYTREWSHSESQEPPLQSPVQPSLPVFPLPPTHTLPAPLERLILDWGTLSLLSLDPICKMRRQSPCSHIVTAPRIVGGWIGIVGVEALNPVRQIWGSLLHVSYGRKTGSTSSNWLWEACFLCTSPTGFENAPIHLSQAFQSRAWSITVIT
jgi:hypothetical protein